MKEDQKTQAPVPYVLTDADLAEVAGGVTVDTSSSNSVNGVQVDANSSTSANVSY